MKKLLLVLLIVLCSASIAFAGWEKENGKWYYLEFGGRRRTADLQTDVFLFKFAKDGHCINFYENKTPSVEAGWSPYSTGSLKTILDEIAKGHVVKYNGQYWATPDYLAMMENENVVYMHDISQD